MRRENARNERLETPQRKMVLREWGDEFGDASEGEG